MLVDPDTSSTVDPAGSESTPAPPDGLTVTGRAASGIAAGEG
ncbi:hypothetical protein [Actinomycetospora callitridis]|nr:hypothetical protein [Actinomycetospora callitridis]MDD7921218.1 hypothetical protein [Actinomycetospora callitridis]